MASTNKTTNYELSQFVETDKPAWLTDYNGDMRKLDTALKAVSDVADGASGGISSLTDRMTAAEGAITTNANDIDTLEARADNLEAQAQSTAGTIAGIQTEQTAQNLGIEAATELGYNLARPYDSASTYAVGAYVLFQNTLYKCVTAVSTGEAFDPTKWLAIKATDEISAGGYTLPIASASQLGGVKIGDGLNIDPVTGVLNSKCEVLTITDYLTFPNTFRSTNTSITPRQIMSPRTKYLYDMGAYYLLIFNEQLSVDTSTNVNVSGEIFSIQGTYSNLRVASGIYTAMSCNGLWKNNGNTNAMAIEGLTFDAKIQFINNGTFILSLSEILNFTDDGAYAHDEIAKAAFILPKV